jgi:hypothetical protein
MVVPAQETVGTFYVAALNNGTSEVSYSLNVEAPLNIESLGQENLVGGASFNATIVEGQRRWTFVPKGFPAVLYLNIERCNADSPDLQLLVQVFGTDVGDFRPGSRPIPDLTLSLSRSSLLALRSSLLPFNPTSLLSLLI